MSFITTITPTHYLMLRNLRTGKMHPQSRDNLELSVQQPCSLHRAAAMLTAYCSVLRPVNAANFQTLLQVSAHPPAVAIMVHHLRSAPPCRPQQLHLAPPRVLNYQAV
jgi:cell division inhibitor SulA